MYCMHSKEPYIHSKEPYIHLKEPYICLIDRSGMLANSKTGNRYTFSNELRKVNLRPFCSKKSMEGSDLCPTYTQKSPIYTQKSPLYTQKSPIYTQKSPTYTQKSPTYTQKSPTYTQKSPTSYGVASSSRLFKILGLFCRI